MPLPRPSTVALAAAATLALGSLTACSALPDAAAGDHAGHRADGQPGTTSVATVRGLVRTGRGWSSAGIQGPVPAPGSCHYRHADDGEVLPDPHCTPGAVDTAVTPANIGRTICRPGGYSASVRPPQEMTEALKYKMLAAYGVPTSEISDYELDHLVSESLGGSSSTYNLWPEPNDDAGRYPRSEYVANDKDEIEHRSWEAACGHDTQLGQVQRVMATNWTRLAG